MAAEMDNAGSQELAQFWKEVPKAKIMEHRSGKPLHPLSEGFFGVFYQAVVLLCDVTSLLDCPSPPGYAATFWKAPDPQ